MHRVHACTHHTRIWNMRNLVTIPNLSSVAYLLMYKLLTNKYVPPRSSIAYLQILQK